MPRRKTFNEAEARIIAEAQALFIKKGYTETSMREIAAAAQINRPALHYHFRTKDRMFRAVFGATLQKLAPQVLSIVMNQDESIGHRTEKVVDTYYDLFRQWPDLPLFVVREINRDVDFLLLTLRSLHTRAGFGSIVKSLQQEMDEGRIRKVPLRMVFLTFYSLLTFPFLTRGLSMRILRKENESFDDILNEWKPNITRQMQHLLSLEPAG